MLPDVGEREKKNRSSTLDDFNLLDVFLFLAESLAKLVLVQVAQSSILLRKNLHEGILLSKTTEDRKTIIIYWAKFFAKLKKIYVFP